MKQIFYTLLFITVFSSSQAQNYGGGRNAGSGGQTGRFYGKIIDAKTGKPIDAASIQLVTDRKNTQVVSSKDSIVNGQLTESNGDFSLENVALFSTYRLIVTAIGYKTIEKPVSFLTPAQQQKLMQAMVNRRQNGGNQTTQTGNTPVDTSTRTIEMTQTTSVPPMSDSSAVGYNRQSNRPDSANLPTQQLTTIMDSAQMAVHPRPTTNAVGTSDTAKKTTASQPARTGQRPGGMGGENMAAVIREVLGGDMSTLMAQADKDLGNIRLETDAASLGNVTVTASQPVYTLGIDRKVFNVDRALTSQGQTAVEVLRQVPAVNVDIDGNVTLRNSAPTLFVDGRPTTLTLDQIPADAIQSIEVITNPSAKFDASGGTASILNVVMKKNRKNGYNGSIRVGADSRGRFNGGGDLNLRQKKVNLFLSGQYGQRKSKAWSDVNTAYKANARYNAYNLYQNTYSVNGGGFGFLRGGFDYFIDNRNTLTISGNYTKGSFDNIGDSKLIYDTVSPAVRNTGTRYSEGNGAFKNFGGTVSYKHNFAKTGHELTADVNLNSSKSNNFNTVTNSLYDNRNVLKQQPTIQQTFGGSNSTYWVIQTDYANPISANAKIEAGLRAQIRDFTSNNQNDTFNRVQQKFVTNPNINSNYRFNDQVYAAYVTFTGRSGNLGYNVGLRAESSNYNGTQLRTAAAGGDSAFKVDYPITFFPSAFLSYKLTDKQDLQFNYTRRINRPSFFQLVPFTDYSDPQNLTRGNPGLTPEFTNSFEANYSLQINNGNSFLASVYYKSTNNLITRFFDTAYNPNINQTVNRSTYVNANNSRSYGLELTSRNNITRTWDATTNINFYNASINGGNVGDNSSLNINSRFSYFAKLNTNYRFGKNTSWTFQLNGDYQGKTVLPVNSGGGGGRGGGGGGGGFFGGGNSSAGTNGYVNPFYGVDLALKKEFLKNKAMSLTLSVQDVLKTRKRDTYTTTDFYTQSYVTRRDQQIFRLQFNWRFGKQDISLFKRKNNRTESDGMNEGVQ